MTSGEIWFLGKRIGKVAVHDIVNLGIAHIPEGRKLLSYMSVLANPKLGIYLRNNRTSINRDMDGIFKRFLVLSERRNQQAGTLSGGEQQMLTIARALMTNPELILMDEPSEGLAPLIVEKIRHVMSELKESGFSILLVEQHLSLDLAVAGYAYIIGGGQIVHQSPCPNLRNNEDIKTKYLGVSN